jgi:hypothetical protein
LLVLGCFDEFFAILAKIFSCGRKIRESFKDLKEFHEFFEALLFSATIFDGFERISRNSLNDSAFFNNLSLI